MSNLVVRGLAQTGEGSLVAYGLGRGGAVGPVEPETGCLTIEIEQNSLSIDTLTDQQQIDLLFAELELQFDNPQVEIEVRGATLKLRLRVSTLEYELAATESDVAVVVARISGSATVQSASEVRSADASTALRQPSTTIDPGDCP